MKEVVKNFLVRLGWHTNTHARRRSGREVADLQALHLLPELDINYFPWTSFTLRPSAVRICLNEMSIHRRKKVIEFGGGISTLMFARHLSRTGGLLVTVEHDKEWLAVIEQYLQEMQVPSSTYTLVHAPLTPIKPALDHAVAAKEWYDASALDAYVKDHPFDMVLVDGPPAYQKEKGTRYPALPYIREHLESDYAVFIDDVDREGEHMIANHWCERYDLHLNVDVGHSGLGVLRPLSTKSTYHIV